MDNHMDFRGEVFQKERTAYAKVLRQKRAWHVSVAQLYPTLCDPMDCRVGVPTAYFKDNKEVGVTGAE